MTETRRFCLALAAAALSLAVLAAMATPDRRPDRALPATSTHAVR